MPVTIDDVARRAAVSIKTVSRVVNKEPHVRDALRERVNKAIEELGYSPNIAARRLASNASFTIGLLVSGDVDEYFSQVILSVLDQGKQHGYALLVSGFKTFDERSRKEVGGLVRRKFADGLIITPPCDNDETLLRQLQKAHIPFVRLTPMNISSSLPSVSADDRRGAYEMTEYLIGLGHRRIGFISGPETQHAGIERFQGFRDALEDRGIPFNPAWVRPGDFSFEGGMRQGAELMSLRNRPTAIFASNDESASGVLVAAHMRGISVPGDISVAGFDDFPSATKNFPALTTVNQNIQAICAQATNILVDLIKKRKPKELQVKVSTRLVVRDSTGPLQARQR